MVSRLDAADSEAKKLEKDIKASTESEIKLKEDLEELRAQLQENEDGKEELLSENLDLQN